MLRRSTIFVLSTALLVGACDTTTAPSEGTSPETSPIEGPTSSDFTLGGIFQLTTSAADAWPELEGDYVAWYRSAPAEEQGLWIMDLTADVATHVWSGTILSAFDLLDGVVYFGAADGLYAYEIASSTLTTLADGFRQYKDVRASESYVTATATQSSARPLVYDRATGTETLIPSPTSVPATRGWGDYILWTDHREAMSIREFYLYHIPSATETAITDQTQLLTADNSEIADGRVVYFASRFCPGALEVYDIQAGTTAAPALPAAATCPVVVELEGDVLVYRYNASGGIIYLGFQDLVTGENYEEPLANPGNWRIDADIDGTRIVHTSVDGLTLVDIRFTPPLPPVARAGGPYAVDEGTALTLDGTGSYSFAEATLAYRWDLSGTIVEGTATPTHTWADDGDYPVVLTVTEENGLFGEEATVVSVSNVAPTIDVAPDAVIALGQTAALSASFTDAGAEDAPWKWSWSVDGQELLSGAVEAQGELPAFEWTPDASGDFLLTLRVGDKDGAVGEAQVTLSVAAPARRAITVLPVKVGTGSSNSVPRPHSNGIVHVVVFGSESLALADLDLGAFRLGPGEAAPASEGDVWMSWEDVDGDDVTDLRLRFRAREAGYSSVDTEVCLTAATNDGETVVGCSPITVAGR